MGMVQAALDDRRLLKEIMNDAQDQAAKNGLTREKLDVPDANIVISTFLIKNSNFFAELGRAEQF